MKALLSAANAQESINSWVFILVDAYFHSVLILGCRFEQASNSDIVVSDFVAVPGVLQLALSFGAPTGRQWQPATWRPEFAAAAGQRGAGAKDTFLAALDRSGCGDRRRTHGESARFSDCIPHQRFYLVHGVLHFDGFGIGRLAPGRNRPQAAS